MLTDDVRFVEWIGSSQMRDENDSLKCQLEALKNEVDIVKLEAKNSVEMKEKQIKCMQMALQGMQQVKYFVCPMA